MKNESIASLRKKLDRHEIGAVELTKEYLAAIEKTDKKIDSYITVCTDEALKAAEAAQKRIDEGCADALTGIPIAIKDNICTEGVLTTCSSKMLYNFVPPYSATVVEKLKAQNTVLLGKTSLDEFAMGASTQTSYFKKTKNPYDLSRVPGGSSGGSAAAVAAGLCSAALGSDTGGSIRQPSAFCGVTGIKPTYGAVSRFGLVAFASSLDQIGPIASSARDCALVLDAIAGKDPRDSTSIGMKGSAGSLIGQDVKGLRIAIPKEFYGEGLDPRIKSAVLAAADVYRAMGAEIVDVSMPSLPYAIPAYYLISSSEASSNLARFDGVKYGYRTTEAGSYVDMVKRTRAEGFGEEVKRRILLGTYALSSGYYDAYYKKAVLLRERIKREYAAIFESCDAVLTPTTTDPAFCIGEREDDPVKMYLSDIYTVAVNIAGLPAVNTTCGYTEAGLPMGMSIVGPAWGESRILQLADAFEQGFTRQVPNL